MCSSDLARKHLSVAQYVYFMQTYFEEYLSIAETDAKGRVVECDSTFDGRDRFFADYLMKFKPEHRATITAYDHEIRATLGAAFIETGLYPFSFYINSGDQDIRLTKDATCSLTH